MYEYKCKIRKVVDGDTVDIDIDLGFGIWLNDERVRIIGIDTPESRTSDDVEKIFGMAAKERVCEIARERGRGVGWSEVRRGGKRKGGAVCSFKRSFRKARRHEDQVEDQT